jgi:hypothetical protein
MGSRETSRIFTLICFRPRTTRHKFGTGCKSDRRDKLENGEGGIRTPEKRGSRINAKINLSRANLRVGPSILQKEDAVRVGLYIVRPPASASRLQLADDGLLKYVAKGSVPSDRCDSLFEPEGNESDPLLCPKCGTQMKIVSVIKDGAVIDKILAHLQHKFEPLPLAAARPPLDTPPQWDSFSTD